MVKNRIPEILEQRGMTPYQLAQITRLSQNRVYKIVKASEIPPKTNWETVKKIASALEVTPNDLEAE